MIGSLFPLLLVGAICLAVALIGSAMAVNQTSRPARHRRSRA